MMALARNIPQAHGSMIAGEWNRKEFKGVELTVKHSASSAWGASAARSPDGPWLGMWVMAYDPYITPHAKALQVELASLEDIYAAADFITVHTPMTDETRGMLNKDTFATMKPSVGLLNCARGGIINEADLCEALKMAKSPGRRSMFTRANRLPKTLPCAIAQT